MGERAAVWKRVSTDLTRQEIRNQDTGIDQHVSRHDYEVTRTFELAASAYKGEHEADLRATVEDVKAGLYTVIVFAMTSRIERRGWKTLMRYLLELDALGARVEAVDDPNFGKLDDDNPLTGAMTMLKGHGDYQYSKNISFNVNQAFSRMDEEGSFRGRAPFGYRITGEWRAKRLEPDPEISPVIVLIFERCAAGDSVRAIADWLQREHGIRRSVSELTRMVLRRPLYWTGRLEIRKGDGTRAVKRTEPIIGKALFDAANQSLDTRASTVPKPRLPRRDDFSTAVYCPEGHALYRCITGNPGHRLRYYRCHPCGLVWQADVADTLVAALMSSDAAPEATYVIIPGSDHSAELERIAAELQELGQRGLPDEEEDQLRKELRGRRDELKSLPVIPATRKLQFTGRTWGEAWAAMTHAEKIEYMRSGEFQVRLAGRGKVVSVSRVWLP